MRREAEKEQRLMKIHINLESLFKFKNIDFNSKSMASKNIRQKVRNNNKIAINNQIMRMHSSSRIEMALFEIDATTTR